MAGGHDDHGSSSGSGWIAIFVVVLLVVGFLIGHVVSNMSRTPSDTRFESLTGRSGANDRVERHFDKF